MSNHAERKKLKQVISSLLAGDTVQFQIVKTKIIQYVFHQNFGDDVDRDELVSEILDILYRNLRDKKFKGDSLSALNVYIYSIVRHRIYRVLRRRSRLTYTDDEFVKVQQDESPNPEEYTESKDLIDKILAEMDQKCVELLRMKFQECWSDQEIADHLKKSKNATSTAISRCIGKARSLGIVKELM